MDTQEIIQNQHPQPAQWIERLARFGYAAKGVVYALVGILAFQAAFNWGGEVTGNRHQGGISNNCISTFW